MPWPGSWARSTPTRSCAALGEAAARRGTLDHRGSVGTLARSGTGPRHRVTGAARSGRRHQLARRSHRRRHRRTTRRRRPHALGAARPSSRHSSSARPSIGSHRSRPSSGPMRDATHSSRCSRGRNAIGVFETLDHVGVLVRLFPEWEHVRALPQRNVYHRFTVDRHSLEAVAECAALLDPSDPLGDGPDGDVARRGPCRRPAPECIAARHREGESRRSLRRRRRHRTRVRRRGFGSTTRAPTRWSGWCTIICCSPIPPPGVDLNDEATITRFARAVGDTERLDLLYALTLGDSRATGAAAWTSNKALLVRELWVKANALLEEGVLSSEAAGEHRAELREQLGDAADEYLDAMPAATVPRSLPTCSRITASWCSAAISWSSGRPRWQVSTSRAP